MFIAQSSCGYRRELICRQCSVDPVSPTCDSVLPVMCLNMLRSLYHFIYSSLNLFLVAKVLEKRYFNMWFLRHFHQIWYIFFVANWHSFFFQPLSMHVYINCMDWTKFTLSWASSIKYILNSQEFDIKLDGWHSRWQAIANPYA